MKYIEIATDNIFYVVTRPEFLLNQMMRVSVINNCCVHIIFSYLCSDIFSHLCKALFNELFLSVRNLSKSDKGVLGKVFGILWVK